MKTKQFISTIVYNTPSYLRSKCEELYKTDMVDFYAYINHKAEAEELKDHSHLILFPSRKLDTKWLDNFFDEPTGDEDHGLGTCKLWHTVGKNNLSDWLLYALHDPVYCRAKGYGDRTFTYTISDVSCSSRDALNDLYFEALHTSKFYFDNNIRKVILSSDDTLRSGAALVENGYIPLSQCCSFHHFLQIVKGG